MYFLDELVMRRELSAEQIDRYYAQSLHGGELVSRRRYRVGEDLVLGVAVDYRGMEHGHLQNERAASKLLGKIRISEEYYRSRGRSTFNKSDFLTVVFPHKFIRAGQDEVLIRANLGVFGTAFQGGDMVRTKFETKALIEVIPADFDEPVELLTSDILGQQLTSGLSVFLEYPIEFRGEQEIQMVQCYLVSEHALPCSITADVILEHGETAQHLGTIFGWKNHRLLRSNIAQLEHTRFSGEQLSLVLVFNRDLMQTTADLQEVFAGTLRLRPVTVDTLEPPAPRNLAPNQN